FLSEITAETYTYNALDIVINTGFIAEIFAAAGQLVQLDVVIQTGFIADIHAIGIDQYCSVDAVIRTGFTSASAAVFDINHVLGVFCRMSILYQKAIAFISAVEIPWAKPILR